MSSPTPEEDAPLVAPEERDLFHRLSQLLPWFGFGTVVGACLIPIGVMKSTLGGGMLVASVWLIPTFFGLWLWLTLRRWWLRQPRSAFAEYRGSDVHLQALIHAQRYWDEFANQYGSSRTKWAVFVAALAPVAVLCLSLQVLLYRSGRGWEAYGLIGLEIFLIFTAICTVYLKWPNIETHEKWVPARLRAELFRRECFLYRARIGPYLNCENLDDRVNERLARIGKPPLANAQPRRPLRAGGRWPKIAATDEANEASELRKVISLVALEDIFDDARSSESASVTPRRLVYWQDSLEDSRHHHGRLPNTLQENNRSEPDLAKFYVSERLRDQKDNYFLPRSRKHERLDIFYESLSRSTLWLAMSVAIMHLRLLNLTPNEDLVAAVEVSALTLPTVGACFVALRSYFEIHRLSRSYRDQVNEIAKIQALFGSLDVSDPHYDHLVKRLVLRAEALLSEEARLWSHIIGPEAPRGS